MRKPEAENTASRSASADAGSPAARECGQGHIGTSREAGSLHRARSCGLSLAACGFSDPTPALPETLHDPDRWEEWPGILIELHAETAGPLLAFQERARASDLSRLMDDHAQLFGHTVRGRCPLYEMEYFRGEILQQATQMADIAGFYAAFGLELSAGGHERQDHISVECEFLAVLAAKEAYAAGCGCAEALESFRSAQRQFLQDHAGRWIPAFARRVMEADADGLYGALAAFVDALIRGECRRLGVDSGPPLIEVRPVELPEESAMTCGIDSVNPAAGESDLVQLRIDQDLIRS